MLVKLALGLSLSPFLDSDFSLLRGTLDDVHWAPKSCAFLTLHFIGNVTSRPLLDDINYELSHLTWDPFHISFQQVYHRLGRFEDRLTTQPVPNPALHQLYKKSGQCLKAASCSLAHHSFHPELVLGTLETGREHDVMSWIQRHNLFHTQPLLIDQIALIEVFSDNAHCSYQIVENYSCYGSSFPLPAQNDFF